MSEMGQIEEYHSNIKDELGDNIDKLTVMMSMLAAKIITRGSLSNCKYIKVEVQIDPMVRKITKIGHIVEVGDILQIIV